MIHGSAFFYTTIEMNTIRPDCRTIHLPKEKKAAKGEPWNPELVNLEQNSIASIYVPAHQHICKQEHWTFLLFLFYLPRYENKVEPNTHATHQHIHFIRHATVKLEYSLCRFTFFRTVLMHLPIPLTVVGALNEIAVLSVIKETAVIISY